jgi:hypothetical protein
VLYLATDFASGWGDMAAHQAQLADITLLHEVLTDLYSDDVTLHVRPHPLDDPAFFLQVPSSVVIDPPGPLEDAIARSALVLGNTTSALLAALAAGIPAAAFGVHLSVGTAGRLLRSLPWATAPTRGELKALIAERLDPLDGPRVVAAWAERSRTFLDVDPDHPAADRAAELLVDVAAGGIAIPRQEGVALT